MDGTDEGSADREGRVALQAPAGRAGVIPRTLSAPQVIAALFPATALDRIRVLSPQAIRRHSELLVRVMSAEFHHPDHDSGLDICPFRDGFGLEYERPEILAFELRTRDTELAAIDVGDGRGKPERSDWYLMQGTRRSIRRAYDAHRDDPWAQAELRRRTASMHSGPLPTLIAVLRRITAAALDGSRRATTRATNIRRVEQHATPQPEPLNENLKLTPDPVSKENLNLTPDPISEELRRAQDRLANREAALGFNHPDVASELHFIAALHHEAGEYAPAIAAYGMALVIQERTLGPSHPEVASTLEDLAAARRDDGEPEEGERLLLRAQAIRRRSIELTPDPKRVM
jgi:hypothetical protein